MSFEDRVPFWRHIANLTDARSFLDVGCGPGWNMLALRSIDKEFAMSGIDVDFEALKQALRSGLDVVEGRPEQISELLDGHRLADLVVMTGAFKHFSDDAFARAMVAIDDASRQYIVLIDLEPPRFDASAPAPYNAPELAKTGRHLSLIETGAAIGFEPGAQYWLLERST
jgi:SAM-dependent methyltransferase